MNAERQIPSGFCQCGCGQKTRIAPQTRTERGWIKGKPLRFVFAHGPPPPRKPRDRASEYRVDEETGCWVWQRSVDKATGYGYLNLVDFPGQGAHRVYYLEYKGPIPKGMQIDHLCRNRACVNPDHLEVVTNAENCQRGSRAKLTVEKVREIRRSGEQTQFLAERYGVSPITVRQRPHRQGVAKCVVRRGCRLSGGPAGWLGSVL